jgi:hypothetical protein
MECQVEENEHFRHLLLRRVVTSTWSEGLVLPMIPRSMPAGAKFLAGPPKPVRSRMKEEAKNNPRRRELR